MPDSVDDPISTWRALLLAQNAVLRAIDEDLAAEGHVSLQWYDVLLELNAAPDRRLRIKDLTGRTVLTRSRVSKLVDELEVAGLVERQPDPDDRRASLVALTSSGRDALRRAAPSYLTGIEKHFTSHLVPREAAQLTRLLSRVVDVHAARIEHRSSR